MKNLLLSDLYRLMKSKSFYICSLIAAALLVLNIFIMNWSTKLIESLENGMPPMIMPFSDGLSYGVSSFSDGNVHLFIAIFTAIFITTEFVHGTMKNAVSKGFSRTHIYLSKLITMVIAILIMLFVNFIFSTIAATFILGNFGEITGILIGNSLKIIGIELLLHIALTSVFVMIAMIIRNNAATIAINIIGVLSFVSLIYIALEYLFKKTIEFSKFSLLSNIRFYYLNTTAIGTDYLRSFLVGLIFFGLTTALGILAFRRMDVK